MTAAHDEELVEVAKVTISDLVSLVDELNEYTQQLRTLVAEVEESTRDQ